MSTHHHHTPTPTPTTSSSSGDGTTRTLTSIAIVHARPEHLQAIHDIQLACYKDRPDFHESLDVFRGKLQHYPAGNFVALATYSVVAQDDRAAHAWTDASESEEEMDVKTTTVPLTPKTATTTDMEEDPKIAAAATDKPKSRHVTVTDEEDEADVIMEEASEEPGPSRASVPSSTVEIVITEDGDEDGTISSPLATTTTTTTTTTITNEGDKVTIVRARTPDISTPHSDDSDDSDQDDHPRGQLLDNTARQQRSRSTRHNKSKTARDEGSKTTIQGGQEEEEEEEEEDAVISVLAQWEQPIGYLFSHPYTRETVTLHKIPETPLKTGEHEQGFPSSSSSHVRTKKVRLDHEGGGATTAAADALLGAKVGETAAAAAMAAGAHHKSPSDEAQIEEISELEEEEGTEGSGEEGDEGLYEHDPLVEKYFIHDMAVLPDFQGQGLAYMLYKALEDSLTPARHASPSSHTMTGTTTATTLSGSPSSSSAPSASKTTRTTMTTKSGCTVTTTQRWNRRGAPNLKELHLVSVQGTRPFWENRPGFRVVSDHDLDLSVYGEGACYMMRPFHF